ncbi:saccharopine dehydrogenase NADP-binding domain-containing protein [Calidifontibacter indicus]|uniref:saccharopine dehydrogenase NADP-binding domain-containing protein n=1 Tax=Calidifontibacter indicus TaxID=419650 RepID=UPI003D71357E
MNELLRRGHPPVLAGRREEPLRGLGLDLEQRVATVDDADALRRMVDGAAGVINTAGPFLDTGLPVASAAVAAGAHYLDVTAEQPAVELLCDRLDAAAAEADVAVVPAMAFYGGLADLMVTRLLGDAAAADEVTVAIGLDSWLPTAGTRLTGERNTMPRRVIRDGALVPLASPEPTASWSFPRPVGEQEVVELPFSEVLTLHRHLRIGRSTSYLNTSSLAQLRDESTPPPTLDDSRRSAQRFVVDVEVVVDGDTRRSSVSGRDIYASSAPLVVEAALRPADGRGRAVGAVAPGQALDAAELLDAADLTPSAG